MKIEDIQYNETKIRIAYISESIDELKANLNNFDAYQFSYNKIKSEKRKREFLGVRIVLNEMLNESLVLDYDNDGKPFITNYNHCISISHSKNWIAVILHPSKNVGIDIECHSEKIASIAHKFLSTTELSELNDITDTSKIHLAWSAKESLYKIIGNQVIDFSKTLNIYNFDINKSSEIIGENLLSNKKYKLQFSFTKDYYLVYCID